jgi:hypothetical protein
MAQAWLNILDIEIQKTTRLKGAAAGEKISPNPTATEASSMISESQKSVKLIIERIDRNVIAKYFERAYTLLVMNRTQPWLIAKDPVNIQIPMPGQMPGAPLPALPVEKELGMPSANVAPMGYSVPLTMDTEFEEVTPDQIYSDGIIVEMQGISHINDEVVSRNQDMQLLDLMMKYSQAPLQNEKGEQVIFNFYKALNDILNTFNKPEASEWWMPVPPPPPMMGGLPPSQVMAELGMKDPATAPTMHNPARSENSLRKGVVEAPTRGIQRK